VILGAWYGPRSGKLLPILHETITQIAFVTHGPISMACLEPGSAQSKFFICIGHPPEPDHGGQRNPNEQGFAASGGTAAGWQFPGHPPSARGGQYPTRSGAVATETSWHSEHKSRIVCLHLIDKAMHIDKGYFSGIFGLPLFYIRWRPNNAKAALIVLHGFGEHGERYAHLAEYLAARGYAVYTYDQRGHGRSDGQRGHVDSWREYWHDLILFRDFVEANERKLPLFLYGHSMGSLVLLDYLVKQPPDLRGVILSGVLLEPGRTANLLLVAVARLLSRHQPTFSLKLNLDAKALSRDPAVVEAYRQDPLVHNRASARWGSEVLDTMALVKAQVKNIVDPLLILHGEADTINRVENAQWLFQAVASTDKELRIYPGGYREPHNDLQKEQVLQDMTDWLERHL